MDRSRTTNLHPKQSYALLLGATLFTLGVSACRGPGETRPNHGPVLWGDSATSTRSYEEERAFRDQAQDEFLGTDSVSLETLLDFARSNSPGLAGTRERALSRHESALVAGTMPEPKISWTEFFSEVETRVGPQERRFEVSQALPWFGALEADIQAAEATARAASTSIESKERSLFGRIESLLWRRRMYRRSSELEESRIALFESIAATIDGRYRTGKAEYADLLRSRSEIERAKELRDAALDGVEKADVMLRRELGLPRGSRIPTVELTTAEDRLFEDGRWDPTAALQKNPELLRLGHLEEAANQKLDRVSYERKPDITVGAFLIDTGLGDNPMVSGNGNDASGIKLSLSLPIRRDSYDAMERSARHEVRALRKEREDKMLGIQSEVALALEDLRAAQRRRDLIGLSLLPRAQEVLDTTRAGYASDRATYLDLVNAGNSQIGLELELLRAKVDRELARIAIEVRLGRNLGINTDTTQG